MGFKVRWTPEDKDLVIAEISGRLRRGETMASICRSAEMPDPVTVLDWCASNPDSHGQAIARARQAGFDAIADDALAIIDGTKPTEGVPVDAGRDKARAEIRLKLLSKWDPKRYGDAVQLKHADADGEKLDSAPMIAELMGLLRGPAKGESD